MESDESGPPPETRGVPAVELWPSLQYLYTVDSAVDSAAVDSAVDSAHTQHTGGPAAVQTSFFCDSIPV